MNHPAGEVQEAIDEHGAVTVGENEAISIAPFRVVWVMFEMIDPKYFADIRQAHGCAWVTAICCLHSIH